MNRIVLAQINYNTMTKKTFLLAILITICAADIHHGQTITFTIPNVTKINIEDEDRIIGGNLDGEIQVHIIQKNHTQVINNTHSGRILFIEQFKRDGNEEYVVVDQKGLITIWDEDITNKLTSFDLNTTVKNVDIRQKMEGVKENRLVVNCINQVVQYSLDSRTEIRRHTFNQTILAAIYTNSALLLSTNQATVLIFADNGSKIKELLITQGNIILFTKHNHNEWSTRTEQVMGATSGTETNAYLLHIMVESGVDSAQSMGKTAVTSLNYCKGRLMQKDQRVRRRTNDDMLLLGINDEVLQLRTDTNYVRNIKFQQGIRDVACYEEDLFILKGNNQLHLQELDHSEHSGSKIPAIAGGLLLVLIIAVVAYQFSKKKVEKRQKSAQTPNNIEMHELQQPIMKN